MIKGRLIKMGENAALEVSDSGRIELGAEDTNFAILRHVEGTNITEIPLWTRQQAVAVRDTLNELLEEG